MLKKFIMQIFLFWAFVFLTVLNVSMFLVLIALDFSLVEKEEEGGIIGESNMMVNCTGQLIEKEAKDVA